MPSIKNLALASKKRAFFGALSFLLLTGTTIAKAEMTATAQQVSAYQDLSEKERVGILIRLAKSGQHELAASLLTRFPLTGPFAKNRSLFLEGLILHGRGNLTGAAEKYRAALANDPSLTLVRSELAQTLFELEDDESAKHNLKLLMAEAPSQDAANGIRSFIDSIDARRPFTFNTYVSAAPSTNINNGSSIKTVYNPDGSSITVDEASRKKSGIGFAGGGSVGYSKRLGNHASIVATANANARLYDDKTFNIYGTSESAELRYLFQGGYTGFGIVASQIVNSDIDGLSYHSYGPRVSLVKDVSPRNRLSLSSVYEWRTNPDNKLSDGTALMFDGSWSHAFASDATVSATMGYDRVISGIDYNSYKSYSIGMGLYKELPFGITTNFNAQYIKSDFDSIFPIYGVVRDDKRYIGSISLTKRDFNIFGYAPTVEYTYLRNYSNVANYEYDSHSFDFRLTKDF